MSILPAFKAVLDNNLSAEQCDDVLKDIKKIKGVLSAAFTDAAASDARKILVSYHFTLHSAGEGNSVEDKVRKIPGVKEIKPAL